MCVCLCLCLCVCPCVSLSVCVCVCVSPLSFLMDTNPFAQRQTLSVSAVLPNGSLVTLGQQQHTRDSLKDVRMRLCVCVCVCVVCLSVYLCFVCVCVCVPRVCTPTIYL